MNETRIIFAATGMTRALQPGQTHMMVRQPQQDIEFVSLDVTKDIEVEEIIIGKNHVYHRSQLSSFPVGLKIKADLQIGIKVRNMSSTPNSFGLSLNVRRLKKCEACNGSNYCGIGRGDGPHGDADCPHCDGGYKRTS